MRGIISKLLTGRAHGVTTFYIPRANMQQARLVPHVSLVPVDSLRQLYEHFHKMSSIRATRTKGGRYERAPATDHQSAIQISEVVGQEQAKRALLIAAAGGHNLLFSGPPGTGKSMLAKALASVLPPLSHEEVLEVTHLHSLASHNTNRSSRNVPSAHHTITPATSRLSAAV